MNNVIATRRIKDYPKIVRGYYRSRFAPKRTFEYMLKMDVRPREVVVNEAKTDISNIQQREVVDDIMKKKLKKGSPEEKAEEEAAVVGGKIIKSLKAKHMTAATNKMFKRGSGLVRM